MGGKNSGYYMGPLEALGGAGLSAFVPGGAAIGVPMMTAGLGTTIGQAAGGQKGSRLGGLAGGLAGGLGEAGFGLGGMGPLSSQLGPGGSWRSALSNSPIGQWLGGGPTPLPPGTGPTTPAGLPSGAVGPAYPEPGSIPKNYVPPAGPASGNPSKVQLAVAQGMADQASGQGPIPDAADATDKKDGWYDKALKYAAIGVPAASALTGGGGGGGQQQQPQAPVAKPTPQTGHGATGTWQPSTPNVPAPGINRSNMPPPSYANAAPALKYMAGPPSPWGHPLTGQFPGVMDTLRMLGGQMGIQMEPNPPGIY